MISLDRLACRAYGAHAGSSPRKATPATKVHREEYHNALDGKVLQKSHCWLWRKRKRATGPASAPKLRQNRFKYSATLDFEISMSIANGSYGFAVVLPNFIRNRGFRQQPHSLRSFRATRITNFLENGGTLEVAQRIASHADSRTTKLYDRRGQKVLLEDMERITY
jgi:hypothetical protein